MGYKAGEEESVLLGFLNMSKAVQTISFVYKIAANNMYEKSDIFKNYLGERQFLV